VLVLQDCIDLVKAEPGSCTETCVTSSCERNEVTGIKVEVTDETEEEGQELVTSPVVKAELEVRCMYVCMYVCMCVCVLSGVHIL
jgi:hypothetical protein